MLVLSRYPNESIMIGDDVEVFILDVQGKTVKLGFKAPKGVKIYRKEVFDKIRRERETENL